jgi:hypothetical protein
MCVPNVSVCDLLTTYAQVVARLPIRPGSGSGLAWLPNHPFTHRVDSTPHTMFSDSNVNDPETYMMSTNAPCEIEGSELKGCELICRWMKNRFAVRLPYYGCFPVPRTRTQSPLVPVVHTAE